MSFNELGLAEPILRAVAELGYSIPTPIQIQAIPAVLAGGDLLAGAQTGTGKTAGFMLPILHRLSTEPQVRNAAGAIAIRALILTPTRELAAQVEESARQYGKHTKLKSMVMFGGVGINPQIGDLRRGVDMVVATPGRLLFSATFSEEIKDLADGLLNAPAMIEVARRNTTAETVSQKVHPVDRDKKRELLTHLIKEHNWFQVLVFTRTKHGANRLAEQLSKDGISSLAIHGNKSQSARTRALAEFKDASLQVLVATDIAARGIDIDQLPHVVNYDLPNVAEDYVHRIGRTGRAGSTGEAVSLVCVDEHELLTDIEKLIKRKLPKEVIAGFEPDPTARAQPIQLRSQGGGGGGGGGGRHQQQPKRATGSGAANGNRRAPTAAPGAGGQPGRGPRPARSGPAPTGGLANGPARRSGGRGR